MFLTSSFVTDACGKSNCCFIASVVLLNVDHSVVGFSGAVHRNISKQMYFLAHCYLYIF